MAEDEAAVRRFIEDSVRKVLAAVGNPPQPVQRPRERTSPLDIAIPVYNNAALLERCLASLLPTLADGDEVWLLDDASTEPECASAMQAFADRWPATHQLRNAENLGFVGTSNRAFSLTCRDIVLLNSDTEVAPGWLEEMQACLWRNPHAGIVCPLSDRATLLSVLPGASVEARAPLVEAAAATTIGDVELPTAVGFCMLIRREMLDEIGGFSQAFAPGYGEENDLSMRALKAGWKVLAADQACVFHHSGGSFTESRRSVLQRAHQQKLDRLWPEYGPLVQSWWRDNPLRMKTEQIAWAGDSRAGIVHVLHRQYHVGGTERVARSLIHALRERYRHTLLYPGETSGAWCDFEWRSGSPCREMMLNNRWIRPTLRIAGHGADFSCPHSERALARIVRGSRASIVHFHHLLHWDSLLLPALARALGCRVVISVHDFWFNCPIHNQLEHARGQPCGRSHAHADARCGQCLRAHAADGFPASDQHESVTTFVKSRYQLIRRALLEADAVLVPSHFIRDRLLQAYALPPDHAVRIEPHGVEIPRDRFGERVEAGAGDRAQPLPGAERVVAYFGGDQVLKGAQLVLHMARSLADVPVRFRIHGRVRGFDAATLPPNVELRGFYNPGDVGQAMAGADLAVIPSYYEESFSMVASECWAHGVPVLASPRGALRERVIPGVNGWLVHDMEPDTWVNALRSVLDGDALERCRTRLAQYPVTSLRQSADSLDRLYQQLLEVPGPALQGQAGSIHAGGDASSGDVRPAATPPAFIQARDALRSGTTFPAPRNGNHCLGILRDHWGTANYRVRFPLQELAHAGASDSSTFHVVKDNGFDVGPALRDSGARHIVVQPFISDQGLRLMETLHRESRYRLTMVVDDLWTGVPMDNPVRALMPEDVPGRLEYAASFCQALVLTTDELRRRIGLRHENTHVINNALPEWVWNSLPRMQGHRRGRLRIGWSGAPQHAGDLAFLEPVMQNTRDLADWVFLGMCPEALRPLAAEVHGMVPFDSYPAALAALRLDLAIAPLEDNAFNRCKSHLKVLEYGILGIPVIAGDLEPYRACPVTLVAPGDVEEWTVQISRFLGNEDLRLQAGRDLRNWVCSGHLMQHRRGNWAAALGIVEL